MTPSKDEILKLREHLEERLAALHPSNYLNPAPDMELDGLSWEHDRKQTLDAAIDLVRAVVEASMPPPIEPIPHGGNEYIDHGNDMAEHFYNTCRSHIMANARRLLRTPPAEGGGKTPTNTNP